MKKSFVVSILASIFLTASIIIIGILVGAGLSDEKLVSKTPNENNISEVYQDVKSEPAVGSTGSSIAIPGFDKLIMQADKNTQIVKFGNPSKNSCYFRVTLALADGTEIYRSGMIKPGQCIESIELKQALAAGVYKESVLQYDCYSFETLQKLNGATTILNLEVIKE